MLTSTDAKLRSPSVVPWWRGGISSSEGSPSGPRGPASERSENDVAFGKEVGQVLEDLMRRSVNRRTALKAGAAAALASQTVLLEQLAIMPSRPAFAAPAFPDIQFDN